MKKKKFFLITTIPNSLNFFSGQIKELGQIYDVTLISSFGHKLKDIADEEKVKYKGVSMQRDISPWRDIISFIKILIFFSFNRPYAIHCNTPKASLLALVVGYILRIPRRIYYIHGLRYEGAQGKKRKLLKLIEYINCWCATDIIAVSNGVKVKVESEIINKNIKVIFNGSPNGIDVKSFTNYSCNIQKIKRDLEIGENDFIFGFVGRIVSDKGINELVEAFNSLSQKNIKLILVGRYEHELDPLNNQTLSIIKNNPNIIECGFQKDVKKFLSIMNIFVSPSYREGFGLSVIEANAMGKPAIVTKITGYEEIIEEGFNGFYICPKDKTDLYDKMSYCIANASSLHKMSINCITMISKKYERNDVQEHAIMHYKNILG